MLICCHHVRAGLIGWVPNTDTLHALIREYRDARKIPLNVEHRLMLGMAPDYDHLPLINKVEVFQHALDSTSGRSPLAMRPILNAMVRICTMPQLIQAYMEEIENVHRLVPVFHVLMLPAKPASIASTCVHDLSASMGAFVTESSHSQQHAALCRGRSTQRAVAEVAKLRGVAGPADHIHALHRGAVGGGLPPGPGGPPPLQPHAGPLLRQAAAHRLRRLLRSLHAPGEVPGARALPSHAHDGPRLRGVRHRGQLQARPLPVIVPRPGATVLAAACPALCPSWTCT